MVEWGSQIDAAGWQYVVLFVLAALPWLDVFLVVPLGIAWGLAPIGVGIIGFIGNLLTVILLCIFSRQFAAWRERRRVAKGKERGSLSKREERAKKLWERYGLPALALLAPVAVGTDIAAAIALVLGSTPKRVFGWMAVSLAVWSTVMAVGAVYGFGYMNWIRS
ncbi:small multi-drug export protein [Paenibacillus sp. PR3]|uniref:Small multi-drug export protein n=1 Tax=Paenibacillus terricola TaxID=2763503 RepID=A0ABR8N1M1_9BACL|nr:small multi-drug export protein [Paenibacillus terricola]MBD3922053.1 small multi-drug export protein [Paenibacillus terricola]